MLPGMTAERPTRVVLDSPSLFQLLVERRPGGVVNTFDADWRPQWRVDLYPGYKATRREDPPELTGQERLLRAVLDAAGLPVAEAAGYEADDVIGTIAAAAGPRERVAVVTGDRDLFQVVRDPVVWVLYPLRGTSSLAHMDQAAIAAKCGVPPARYADLAILRGDPSDGLPGVPGVGEKTAARLLADHPDLDALLAAAAMGQLPPRVAAALRQHAGYLQAMRRVVPVATDVAYQVSDPHPPDQQRLAALADGHNLDGPVKRLLAAVDQTGLAG
jgi:5'-3' exonuclease